MKVLSSKSANVVYHFALFFKYLTMKNIYYKAKKDWKTSLSGAVMIISGGVGLYFTIRAKELNEAALSTSLATITGGIGLLFGRDGERKGEITPLSENNVHGPAQAPSPKDPTMDN